MKTLHVSVLDKKATYRERDGVIVCGNSDYVIEFVFDSEWDGYDTKTARFIYNGRYENVDFSGNTCPVPVLTNTTGVEVGVYVKGTQMSTTTAAWIGCNKSILCKSAEEGKSPVINGDSAFIRYSAYPDGTDFTETWSQEQAYMGVATGQSAPTEKSGYKWARISNSFPPVTAADAGKIATVDENGNWVVSNDIAEIWATINYVEPTISQLTLNASHSGSVEITSADGVKFTLSGFTHKETSPTNIDGKLTFKRSSGTVLASDIEPTATATAVSASDSVTVKSAQTLSYVLSGTSKKGNTVSKTASVSFYFASYIGGNASESVSDDLIKGLTKVASANLKGTRAVTLNANGYVWFISTSTISKITSGGFDVPFALAETYTYNGGSYKCYKTQSLISAGTYTYVIS